MSTEQEVYIPDYTSNLLLLSRLKKTEISYHNRHNYIILKRGNKEIV